MKLYTEEQLHQICQDVAEKCCANNIDMEIIKDKCDYYGYSKIVAVDPELITKLMEDDSVDLIEVEIDWGNIEKESLTGITRTQLKNLIIDEKNRINALSNEEFEEDCKKNREEK